MREVKPKFIEDLCERYPCKYKCNELVNCYCINEDDTYTACFNKDGQCFTEDFKTLVGVFAYLETKCSYAACREIDTLAYEKIKEEELLCQKN